MPRTNRHPGESGGPEPSRCSDKREAATVTEALDSRVRGNDEANTLGPGLLEFRGVDTHYGDLHVLKSVDYRIERGEIVCLLGGNASGKSTTMKAIMGSVRPTSGDILYEGKSLAGIGTAERVRRGIAPVLEARRLFPRMTVFENLEMGAYTRPRGPEFDEDLARAFALFPPIKERLWQIAGTLSGGEQQMVAIARALMARPRLLCMDEPSMGLSPAYVEQVFDIIRTINQQGVTIFMVEQNANMALEIADRAYVLQTGQVVLSGRAAELRENELIRQAYLGELKVI
jgi:branched-chain amino acid transport system ATP-binding protein